MGFSAKPDFMHKRGRNTKKIEPQREIANLTYKAVIEEFGNPIPGSLKFLMYFVLGIAEYM